MNIYRRLVICRRCRHFEEFQAYDGRPRLRCTCRPRSYVWYYPSRWGAALAPNGCPYMLELLVNQQEPEK